MPADGLGRRPATACAAGRPTGSWVQVVHPYVVGHALAQRDDGLSYDATPVGITPTASLTNLGNSSKMHRDFLLMMIRRQRQSSTTA